MKRRIIIQVVLFICCTWHSPSFAGDVHAKQPLKSDTMVIEYQPIGTFLTELSPQTGAPRQGALVPENHGVIEIYKQYHEALKDLDQCDYIIVLYHMHLSKRWHPLVHPPNSNKDFGLFATRSPNRPNSIGFSVIKLDKIVEGKLYVSGIDAYHGTPVLDIKPWLPSIDCPNHRYNPSTEKNLGIIE